MKLLDEYLNDLIELQSVNYQTYEENKLIRRAVERTLHLALESCLDIGQHIIAREGFRTPEDNKDVFVVLSEAGIIPTEMLPNFIAMARFRTLIVHDYARVDNTIVFGILKRHLTDFNVFTEGVLNYLQAGSKNL